MPSVAVVSRRRVRLAAGLAVYCAGIVGRAGAQVHLASPGGDTLRIGYLVQARSEWTRPGGATTAEDLFVRHLRVLAAGRVLGKLTFFVGSDAPNVGKTLPDGSTNKPSMTLYDAWGTFEPADEFKLDLGLLGTPNSHNSVQSISGMLAPDFGPYSFVSTPPSGEKAGRDFAAQARGYLLDGHLEYRAGAFTSVHSPVTGRRPRYLGRVVFDADRAERTVYYSGTTLGAQRHTAFGVSIDHQDGYNAFGDDGYVGYFLRGHKLNVKAAGGRSRLPLGRTSSVAQLTVQAFDY
jgi:hypothetical protein